MPSEQNTQADILGNQASDTPFLGLAPYLRQNIAGIDLRSEAQALLARADAEPDNANLWLNLSLVMFSLGQRELGLAIQGQALAMQRVYHIAARLQPARSRLLMLMAPGDLAANTPLECLLEESDIDLIFYYVSPGNPFAQPLPEHDAAIVCLSEAEANRELLIALETALQVWSTPLINSPDKIPRTGRDVASALLQDAPGLLIPPTWQAPRATLSAVAAGSIGLAELFEGSRFPVVVRPLDSHAGRDLDKIDNPEQLAAYLARVAASETEFFISPFIDYSGADGQFRKYRVALIDGQPFASHMGISAHWMIHYLNAGMYENADKRREEAAFMENFAAFAERHRAALDAIHQRTGLDYICVDCAETADGQLLIFEIDHAMVVHAMDPVELFPYKQQHMRKVSDAFRAYLLGLTSANA